MYGHLRRGAAGGLGGGAAYGLYVALVGNPLTHHVEAATHHAGEHGAEHGGEEASLVGETLVNVVSVLGSVALGLVLGLVVFGVVAYFLEPALPARAESSLLGLGGFLTVSGVPWLVVPPAAPGVESSMATRPAISLYIAMMAIGGLACLSALAAYSRTADRGSVPATAAALALFAAIVGVAVLLAPSVSHHGEVPADLQAAYTGVIVVGQLGLWGVTAAAHDVLGGARRRTGGVDVDLVAAD